LKSIMQYWRQAIAGIGNSFRQQAGSPPRQDALERELLALATEYQTLAGKLELVRADYGRRVMAAIQKIEALEQSRRQTESAGLADAARLAGLEQALAGVEAGRKAEHQQVTALEASLAETAQRLETRGNQLKFLQDSAREQLQALKTALAEASSRLETRVDELRHLQDSAQEQIVALETSLAETVNRFEAVDTVLGELQSARLEQAQQLEAFLGSITDQLEANSKRNEALEKRLDVEHRLQQNMFEDMQAQLRKQNARLRQILVAAVFVLLLVAAAGAILFRGVH